MIAALALAASQAADVARDYRRLEAIEASTAATPDPIDARVEALRRIVEANRQPAPAASAPPSTFEWHPPEPLKLDPPPSLPRQASPLSGFDFDDRLVRGSGQPADTTPRPHGMTLAQSLAASASGLALLAALAFRDRLKPAALHFGRSTLQTIKQRAAIVVCMGAALVLADRYVFDGLEFDPYFTGLHDAGWIALFGGLVALVGIYHWITGPPDPKI